MNLFEQQLLLEQKIQNLEKEFISVLEENKFNNGINDKCLEVIKRITIENITRKRWNEFFFNIEKHFKDNQSFWHYQTVFWQGFGFYDERWMDAWKRNGRLDVHLNQRTKWMSFLDKDQGKYALDWLRNRSEKHEITVYRGFTVADGKRIRGADNKDEVGYYEQEEGKGFSYSLSKQQAIKHTNAHGNDVILKKYMDDRLKEIKMDVGSIRKFLLKWQNDERDYSRAAFWGTYKINKRDIIGLLMSSVGEQEVICSKAKLHRYEVITAETALTAYLIAALKIDLAGRQTILNGQEEERLWKRMNKGVKTALKSYSFTGMLGEIESGRRTDFLNKVLQLTGASTGDFRVAANGVITATYSSSSR